MIKSTIEEEDESLTDSGFNLVDSTLDETTQLNTTNAVQTAQTVSDPVSTPVTEDTTQTSTPSTPSTPPAQNNPPQQGGYGGY